MDFYSRKPKNDYSFTPQPSDTQNNCGCSDCYQIVIKSNVNSSQARINTGFLAFYISLPLNRARRLRREVVENAVDVFYFGGDSLCDVLEKLEGNVLDGGGHGVGGVDGADDGGIGKGALAVLDAHALEVGHGGKVLPDLAL